MPTELELANAELLRRREALKQERQSAEASRPLENSLIPLLSKLIEPDADVLARQEAAHQEWEEAQKAEEARRVQEARERRLQRAQIPERHSQQLLRVAPEWTAASDGIQAGLGSGMLIALLGIRGAGKTQLAVEAIRQTVNQGGSGRYVKAMDLLIRFREAFRKDGPAERQVLEEFAYPDLLVIDALEERGQTEFEDRMIAHLIDLRYDACLDTILISNQTREAFAESVGKSAISRIHETGRVIECNWASFRQRAT
jgi:DNA replication protein DnaC